MSYLHCPTCQRAFNVAVQAHCPACGIRPGAPADPTEDIVAAAELLAKAIARATPAQLAAAEGRVLGHARAALPERPPVRALPAPPAPVSLRRAARTLLVRIAPRPTHALVALARQWVPARLRAWT